jgi:pimeloyl-ACP methyl ester carboxylesterase
MDALNIPQASLIGQSTGGGTIINFAVDNQDRVNKIVLVDAAGMPNPLPIMGRISNLPLIGEFMYGLNNDLMRKITLRNTFINNPERITDQFFENATRFHKISGSTEAMLAITRKDFFGTLQDRIEKLGSLKIPMLIIWGREERSIPLETGIRMHQLLPGSVLEILDEAGHCPNIDNPQLCNQIMLSFLSGNQNSK